MKRGPQESLLFDTANRLETERPFRTKPNRLYIDIQSRWTLIHNVQAFGRKPLWRKSVPIWKYFGS